MEDLLPSLVTGALTLIGGIVGYFLSGRREKKRRIEDQALAMKRSQLRAVADFFSSVRQLQINWREYSSKALELPYPDSQAYIEARESLHARHEYITSLLDQVENLELYIYEEVVSVEVTLIKSLINDELRKISQRFKSLREDASENELLDLRLSALLRDNQELSRLMNNRLEQLHTLAKSQFGKSKDREFRGLYTTAPPTETL